MNPPTRLALFLKAPVAGRVKTRLAATVGDATACAVYRWLAERQCREVPGDWSATVHVDPPDAVAACRAWLGARFDYAAQQGGTLGERLAHAARAAFTRGAAPWLVIGGDCVGLGHARLREAAGALADGADAVLGPAEDGGYYLLGLRRLAPEVFHDIPWSTGEVAAVTRRRAAAAGLRLAELPPLPDIDDEASLVRHVPDWRARLHALTGETNAATPRTASGPTA
jgi:rSAM/selenodomain-associated transferase 1